MNILSISWVVQSNKVQTQRQPRCQDGKHDCLVLSQGIIPLALNVARILCRERTGGRGMAPCTQSLVRRAAQPPAPPLAWPHTCIFWRAAFRAPLAVSDSQRHVAVLAGAGRRSCRTVCRGAGRGPDRGVCASCCPINQTTVTRPARQPWRGARTSSLRPA